jgi:hypothetical protein
MLLSWAADRDRGPISIVGVFGKPVDVSARLSGRQLGELATSRGEAHVECVDFTEPSFVVGFGAAVDQVVADVDPSEPLGRMRS